MAEWMQQREHYDEALSKEHLLSSFGLFSIAVGGKAVFTKLKSNDLGPSGKTRTGMLNLWEIIKMVKQS
ncbi:hypothetical protein [Virgibacillus salexigens]|uniref:hypothetical protein n=1 Tax=Virgibacillus salexigens TaxID=61016 RepID=UPI00190C78DD|nr:hypothetical protein [Virgibacillus salexigens]